MLFRPAQKKETKNKVAELLKFRHTQACLYSEEF